MNTQETTNTVKNHFQDNKKAWIWTISTLVAIALIVVLCMMVNKDNKTQEGEEATTEQTTETETPAESIIEGETAETPTEAPATTPTETPTKPTLGTQNPSIVLGPNYTKAKAENTDKALVFGDSCAPAATELKVAKNTLVFLGNEGQSTLSLGLNGKTSSLASSHYDLFFVGGSGTYKVSCNGNETASVVVEG